MEPSLSTTLTQTMLHTLWHTGTDTVLVCIDIIKVIVRLTIILFPTLFLEVSIKEAVHVITPSIQLLC